MDQPSEEAETTGPLPRRDPEDSPRRPGIAGALPGGGAAPARGFDEDGRRAFEGYDDRETPPVGPLRFPDLRPTDSQQRPPATPPPPPASARFPDTPPSATGSLPRVESPGVPPRPATEPRSTTRSGDGLLVPPPPVAEPKATVTPQRVAPGFPQRPFAPPRPSVPAPPVVPPRRASVPEETFSETTRRLRPIPAEPPADPPSKPAPAPAGAPAGRPFVSLAPPDTYDDDTARLRPIGARVRPRVAAAAACVVLGFGLIGGSVAGSWLTGDGGGDAGARDSFTAAGDLWHSVPVDELFPPTVEGEGAGPGGADRTWTRIAVAPDSGCADAFDPLLRKALAPAGCLRLLRATYTDATRSHVTTVGLLFTKADSAAMGVLSSQFEDEGLDGRRDLMPRPYAAKGTVAAGFGDDQRASWTVSVLTDAPVVVYAVSGFADGRAVTEPQPAEDAMKTDATTPPAQAGLGHDAQGLADRIERGLRKTVNSATEKPS
ncbi:hypothetical protein [Streptomyces flaveus]|uniref:hypothetical protein n=1 Tax=Streptomyces flaveus TaxID=66370 RepID=UPI003319D239